MSDYGGNNYNSLSSFVGLISLLGEINAQLFQQWWWQLIRVVALSLLSCLACASGIWKCCWSLLHHPNGKNSRALVARPNNRHCTVMSLVVGNELPHYLPDIILHAHCTEWLGQVLLGFFGSQLVEAGGDLSSGPLGWACFCTVLIADPGHRPCEVPRA